MLVQLKLINIALIEIIEINFEKGLNIITGDSGSGKSLILDSLNVLFGGTNIPLKHLIRPGKNKCFIEAIFSSSTEVNGWLIKNGFKEPFSELRVKRYSYKKNKKIFTKYTLNDLTINKTILEELSLLLIDFAGQSDSNLFDSQERRRTIIDDLGSKELKATNLEVKKIWTQFQRCRELIKDKIESSRKQEENNLALKEMFNILNEADLNSSNEIIDLESRENILAHNCEINNSIKDLIKNLNDLGYEEPSVSCFLTKSIKTINKVVNFDSKIQEFRDNLLSIQNDVENLILELNLYIQKEEISDTTLDDIQKRLFFLKNLERTFSLELPQLIKKRDELKTYFTESNFKEEIKKLDTQIESLQIKLNALFDHQSSERKIVAKKLEDSVMGILENLGLGNATFSINFEEVTPSGEGINKINFLFSANPDQKLAPLSKVISGGEMSRFLFALKSSISKKPNTFFLDEIDNGLSGKSLSSLVELIKKISLDKQVLCITHQPFLAAAARAHFKVEKNVIDGLTFTSISQLSTREERKNELTELIGGGFCEANDYASVLLEKSAA